MKRHGLQGFGVLGKGGGGRVKMLSVLRGVVGVYGALGCGVWSSGFRAWGLRFRVLSLRFRVWGSVRICRLVSTCGFRFRGSQLVALRGFIRIAPWGLA